MNGKEAYEKLTELRSRCGDGVLGELIEFLRDTAVDPADDSPANQPSDAPTADQPASDAPTEETTPHRRKR